MTSISYDAQQVELMRERVIVVDDEDRVVRSGSKEECHVNAGDDRILLHRAFSVFLFDPQHRLLLQQRASSKITFPAYWANTCCSHPLYCDKEMEPQLGVKRAAVRKLEHELGIQGIATDRFFYLNTIHYHAAGEGGWGEHEIDHVLGVQVTKQEVDSLLVNVNANEVQRVQWFSPAELDAFLAQAGDKNNKISPWFHKMAQHKDFLPRWWAQVQAGQLTQDSTDRAIHKL